MVKALWLFIFTFLSFASNLDLVREYCNNEKPCYLCPLNSDTIVRCSGPNSCPKKTKCIVSNGLEKLILSIDKHFVSATCSGCRINPDYNFTFTDNGDIPPTNKLIYRVITTFTAKESGIYRIFLMNNSYVYCDGCNKPSYFPYYMFALEAYRNGHWEVIDFTGENLTTGFGKILPKGSNIIKSGTLLRIVLYSYFANESKYTGLSGILKVYLNPYICPAKYSAPCRFENGDFYCSPCWDAWTTPTNLTDTLEGENDKQNNGQVTAQGCLGTIYIFNGHDYRCRPPGTQTGFSDCCKKEHTWFGLGRCSERERYLSRLRAWGQRDGKCHYIGSYCAEKWLGVCVQKKKTFCCYSSPLARIIIEAAHQQLGIPWGDPKHPNCRGLTPEEFQKLDFSKIDFSEWIDNEIQQNIVPSINTSLQNALNNMQTTVSTSVPSSP